MLHKQYTSENIFHLNNALLGYIHNTLQVTVLSGSNITVNLTGSDPDMHVVLSILAQDKNPPGWICGNATWFYVPGICNIASNGQKEPEFFKTWM